MNDGKIIRGGFKDKIMYHTTLLYSILIFTSFMSSLLVYGVIHKYTFSTEPQGIIFWPYTITRFLFDYPRFGVYESKVKDLANYLLARQNISDIGNIILYLGLSLLIGLWLIRKYYRKKDFKYLPCPYDNCTKSVLIKFDWQCDNCNNFQGSPRYISDSCVHCKRELNTVFCEHCHGEIRL